MNINNSPIKTLMYDKAFRQKIANDVDAYAEQLGYVKSEGVEFKLVTNTANTFYTVFPHMSAELSENLGKINATGAFTVSTAGSAGCLCSTVSTLGSAGTALVINGKTY